MTEQELADAHRMGAHDVAALHRRMREVIVRHPRTAKEIVAENVRLYSEESDNAWLVSDEILKALRDGGYDILERVSVYKSE